MSNTIPVIPEFLQVGMKLKLVKCTEGYSRLSEMDVGHVLTITKVSGSWIDARGGGITISFRNAKTFSNGKRTWEVLCE